jgi:hypothetical protein
MKLHTLRWAVVVVLTCLLPNRTLWAAGPPVAEGKKSPAAEGAAQPAVAPSAGPVKVEIRRSNGEFRLFRGGQSYYIKGAGYQ